MVAGMVLEFFHPDRNIIRKNTAHLRLNALWVVIVLIIRIFQ